MTYHGIRKCCRNSNRHPPKQPFQEVPALPPYKTAYQPPIQLGNIQADHCSKHQEYAMTDDQPEFFTLPTRYTDLQ